MTERRENVEPPLASRRVQITLAVLASTALVWLLMTTWWYPSFSLFQDILAHQREGLGETAVLRIDLNVAEPRELSLLPGVGPVLASRIAENRIRLGPFASVDDLSRVYGIGPKTLNQLREICVVDSQLRALPDDERLASVGDFDESEKKGSFDPDGR